MPIYEYKCTICEEHFEVEQSIKANTLKTIKGDDHTHKVKKVFHAPGISFKGDGFYKNDARGKKKEAESGSSSSSDSSSASSSDSKSSDAKASDKKSESKKAESKSSDKKKPDKKKADSKS